MQNHTSSTPLSESQHGLNWLNQFDVDDKEIAKLFLDNLELVGSSKFREEINNLLDVHVKLNKNSALFAVRKLSENETYFNSKSLKNSKVNALSLGANTGSEAIVSNIIRSFCKSKNYRCLNHPDIGKMRNRKSRKIYLVDDLIGTGDRVLKFIKHIKTCRTLLSWFSYGLIDITIICYACTESAHKKVEKELKKFFNKIKIVQYTKCTTLSINGLDLGKAELRKQLIKEMLQMILKYSLKGNIDSRYWNGYEKCNAMIAFQHGCPNNVPGILWCSGKQNSWNPLFPNRVVLPQQGGLFPNDLTNFEILKNFEKFSNIDLTSFKNRLILDTKFKKLLIILELCMRKKRKITSLCHYTKLSHTEVKSLLEHCINMSWLEANSFKLTERGQSELKIARKYGKKFNIKFDIEIRKGEINYFPKQLREPDHG